MVKKAVLILALGITCSSALLAQVPRKTIVEHFTNTKCSVCSNRNPGLNANFALHPDVLHISIHPSSPYITCFLSLQNAADNDARANYYGVYGGTPRIVIGGGVIANSTNYADTSLFAGYAGLSGFTIGISQYAISADSIRSRIVVKRVVAGPPTPTATLYAGLVEDTVFGNGGNGELQHYNVLRRSLFTSQGTSISLPGNVGDSTVLTKTEAYDANWDANRIATVAILQESTNKAVMQSEISGTHKIEFVTGVDPSIAAADAITIFPNPASDRIHISSEIAETWTYEIINVAGALLQRGATASGSIDISGLPGGLYTIVLHKGAWLGMRKFVKH